MNDIFIVIPTLNPNIKVFEKFLNDLQKKFKNILVVDDGCRDEYSKFFKEIEDKGIIVIHHYINLGKGRALKDAYNFLLNNYPNLKGVVTADSDGQHSISDVYNCAQFILSNSQSLVLGCRDFDKLNVPPRNRLGNKVTSGLFKTFLGISISDTQTGLRGLPKDVMIKFLDTPGERFEYETKQIIETIDKKISIKEIPIKTIYGDAVKESHYKPLKDSFKIFMLFKNCILNNILIYIIELMLFSLSLNLFKNYTYSIILSTLISHSLIIIFNYVVNIFVCKKNKMLYIENSIINIIKMVISGFFVNYLFYVLKKNIFVIKIFVDLIIFIINFIIQSEVLLKNEKEK